MSIPPEQLPDSTVNDVDKDATLPAAPSSLEATNRTPSRARRVRVGQLVQAKERDGVAAEENQVAAVQPTATKATEPSASSQVKPLFATLSARYPALAPYLARADIIALGLIVIAAFALRLINLDRFPNTFNPDEADNTQDALRIIYGMPPDNGIFGYDWKPQPAFSIYMLSTYLRIFGESIFAARLPSALLSTLALIPFFFLLRRQLSVVTSLLATVLLATNLWYLNFSRSGWENVHICFYMLMTMLFLNFALDGLRKRNVPQWWLWFSFGATGFFCALGLYGYFGGRAIVLAVIAYFPIALWFYRRRGGKLLIGYLIVGGVVALMLWPEVVYYVQNPDKWKFFNRRSETVLLFNNPQYQSNLLGALMDSAVRNFRGLWFYEPSRMMYIYRYIPMGQPLLDAATGLLVFVGMVLSFGVARFRRRPETYLWWAMFLVCWIFTEVITTNTPDGARGVGWMPTLIFFAALGVEAIVLLSSTWMGRYRWIPVSLTALAIFIISYANVNNYVNWQNQAQTRYLRTPYLAYCEFPTWRQAVENFARNHRYGFAVSDWRATHPTIPEDQLLTCPPGSPDVNPPRPGETAPTTPSTTTPSTFVLPSTPRPQWPAPIATIGTGQLLEPRSVAVDSSGNVYVIDSNDNTQTVNKYDATGKLIQRWGGPGGADDNEKFQNIWAIAIDKANEILVLDQASYWIHVYDSNGKFLRKWGGPAALMFHPRSMTIDAQDRVYIADTGNRRVLVYDVNGQRLRELGNKKAGVPDAEALTEPSSAVGSADNSFFVADSGAQLIRSYNAAGRQQTSWTFAPTDPMLGPRLALAPDGSLYATAPTLCAIVHYSATGVAKEEAGNCDNLDYLAQPSGIAIAGGKLYVSDLNKRIVQVYALGSAATPITTPTLGSVAPLTSTMTLTNSGMLTNTLPITATTAPTSTNK